MLKNGSSGREVGVVLKQGLVDLGDRVCQVLEDLDGPHAPSSPSIDVNSSLVLDFTSNSPIPASPDSLISTPPDSPIPSSPSPAVYLRQADPFLPPEQSSLIPPLFSQPPTDPSSSDPSYNSSSSNPSLNELLFQPSSNSSSSPSPNPSSNSSSTSPRSEKRELLVRALSWLGAILKNAFESMIELLKMMKERGKSVANKIGEWGQNLWQKICTLFKSLAANMFCHDIKFVPVKMKINV